MVFPFSDMDGFLPESIRQFFTALEDYYHPSRDTPLFKFCRLLRQ
jgi:hypothetical protein